MTADEIAGNYSRLGVLIYRNGRLSGDFRERVKNFIETYETISAGDFGREELVTGREAFFYISRGIAMAAGIMGDEETAGAISARLNELAME